MGYRLRNQRYEIEDPQAKLVRGCILSDAVNPCKSPNRKAAAALVDCGAIEVHVPALEPHCRLFNPFDLESSCVLMYTIGGVFKV